MKLVTFTIAGARKARAPAPGVLIDGGTKVAALPGFSSVLEIVEGGQNALDRAHETAKQAMKSSPVVLGVQNVTLLAPIPHPPAHGRIDVLVNCVGGSWGITRKDLLASPPLGFRGVSSQIATLVERHTTQPAPRP